MFSILLHTPNYYLKLQLRQSMHCVMSAVSRCWHWYVFHNEPPISWSLPDNVSVRGIGNNYWRTKFGISKNRCEHSVEVPAVGYCRYHEQRKTCTATRNLMSRVVLLRPVVKLPAVLSLWLKQKTVYKRHLICIVSRRFVVTQVCVLTCVAGTLYWLCYVRDKLNSKFWHDVCVTYGRHAEVRNL